MKKKLFVVGNGFDLAHGLPTDFFKHFKPIAEKNETIPYFWDIYQTEESDIWSDFENCLAHPDFNKLECIFYGYAPDFLSDHESDRDSIITQVDLNGNLIKSLYEFAEAAEDAILGKIPLVKYGNLFTEDDYFVTFNYTHTLERLYKINPTNILHVHGQAGKNNLILGYPKGMYAPAKYVFDVRQKGRGPYAEYDVREFVKCMPVQEGFDYYTTYAWERLIQKTESFYKEFQEEKTANFLASKSVDEIVIVGHSCKIDFEYFQYLRELFPCAYWVFNPHNSDDRENNKHLISLLKLREGRYTVNPIE